MPYVAVRLDSPPNTRDFYQSGTGFGFAASLGVAALLMSYSCSVNAAANGNASPEAMPSSDVAVSKPFVGWAKGRVLVSPRAGLSAAEFDKALKPHRGKSKAFFESFNTHVVELPDDVDEVATVEALRKDKRFKHVELDMAVTHAATVTDPSVSSSWALPKIQAPTAWDTSNGNGVIIAILDTGVDGSHPDLASNLVPGWNVYDNNANTADVFGHGTKVAGAAAAVANNGAGSAGVAWGAQIMPIRVSDPSGYAYWSTVAQGIYWAADQGAKVVNVSYNGVSGSSTVQSAAQYLRNKGGVVIVAAGNSGGLESIAANDSLLSVAATDSNDARASFSSYGDYVDLAAPGVSIYAPAMGGSYAYVSGTSFSSPIVAATAALMLSANPNIAPADVDRLLKSTALDLGTAGNDQYFGTGRVNAAAAVSAASQVVARDTTAPNVTITSPAAGSVSGLVAVDIAATDNVGVTRAEFYVNGQMTAADDQSPFAFAWDTTAKAAGSHDLTVSVYDAAGNRGTSPVVTVKVGSDTTPPAIASTNLYDGMRLSLSKQSIQISATDNQGVSKISLSLDGKEIAVALGPTMNYTLSTRKLASGSHTLTVVVTDNSGNMTTKTYTVSK